MTDKKRFTNNVTEIRPGGLTVHEAEVIETIAEVVGMGEVSIADMEFTSKSLQQIIEDQRPAQAMEVNAFAFPAWTFTHESEKGTTCRLLVVDQGKKRVFYSAMCDRRRA